MREVMLSRSHMCWHRVVKKNADELYMPRWDLAELVECNKLLGLKSEEEVEELYSKWGGSARYHWTDAQQYCIGLKLLNFPAS